MRGLKGWPERDLTFNPTLRDLALLDALGSVV